MFLRHNFVYGNGPILAYSLPFKHDFEIYDIDLNSSHQTIKL